ncbi:MAG: methionine--tRNA ligase subunit beta, partial [Candidatus Zixiibacteriota bacterium]
VVNFKGKMPEPLKDLAGLQPLLEQAEKLPDCACTHIKHFRLGKAVIEAMKLIKATNKYFNDKAPWLLAKEGKTNELGGILYVCCEIIRIVSIVLFPLMPNKMREIRDVFSLDDSTLTLEHARIFFELRPGTEVAIEQSIFPRLKAKTGKDTPEADDNKTADNNNLLDISEFAKADLRVAEVMEAEKIEGTDKLLKLQINLGHEKRQIVAGVAEFYPPEKIKGMSIIVVTNLKPAVIRGVNSNGMLLAASKGKKLTLVTVDEDLAPGSKIS